MNRDARVVQPVVQPTDIELQIEELVLHGTARGDRDALAAQLIAALEPVLSARGLGSWFDGALDGAVVEHISARLAAPRAGVPAAAGTAVGQAIGDALTRPR